MFTGNGAAKLCVYHPSYLPEMYTCNSNAVQNLVGPVTTLIFCLGT